MTVKTTNNLGVLLRSYEALHNWRALAMLAGSFLLAGLAMMGGAAATASSGSYAVSMLMGLVGAIIAIIGINASGLMLVDQAYDQPVRGFGAAFLGGLQAALHAIAALILLGVGFAMVFVAAYLLSLLGRIPGIGGVFGFLLAGPSVVIVALAYAVLVLAAPLMVAAIWHGEGLISSLSRAADIVIKKPLEVLMHFLVLGLVVFPAAVFIFGLVFGASTEVARMYAAVGLGGFAPAESSGLMQLLLAQMSSYGFSGAGISVGLVTFLAWSVVSLIYLLGLIFVYRAVNEGVGSEAAALVGQRLSQFKQRLDGYKPGADFTPPEPSQEPAEPSHAALTPTGGEPAGGPWGPSEATQDATAGAPPVASEPAPGPASPAGVDTRPCPACGATVAADDAFCRRCGQPLHTP
ncbi:MAG: zinc ribbon domain-containing protein [Betaproteobacteria bacterium]|nr:zinc ribbon domain-containing protein [Betaproteobacteria bacterium]MDE2123775.1 zinc ribbon domain-containing protein [Betaproteobacteria bacterium]MDE2185153.1 zinc ribbon domain-containing protein [Betaproteobacteria bacterium]MDE2324100.1 zinc ribbon domain-containing protein [Betaproteobacteria bacterium]